MAIVATGGINLLEEFPLLPMESNSKPNSHQPKLGGLNAIQYAHIRKPKSINPTQPIVTPKRVVLLPGEPNITWKALEIKALIIQENYNILLLGKFLMANQTSWS